MLNYRCLHGDIMCNELKVEYPWFRKFQITILMENESADLAILNDVGLHVGTHYTLRVDTINIFEERRYKICALAIQRFIFNKMT